MSSKDKNERLSLALKRNLKKRKNFQKKKKRKMILNDKQIKKLAEEEGMITPFVDKSVQDGVSYGLQTFGYDLRVGSEFKLFTNIKGNVIADPKNFSEDNFITVKNEEKIF